MKSIINFELRKWQESDAESVAKYANNKKIADNLRNAFPHPYSLEDALYYVNDCIRKGEKTQCTRAICVNGAAVGSIGVFIKDDVYCKTAEIGYWLSEEFWNKGIMTNAIKQLCGYVFLNYDVERIFAEPFAHNIGSRKVLEKARFTLEGIMKKSVYKNAEFFDSCMYAILRD